MLSFSEIYDAYFCGNSVKGFDTASYISVSGDRVAVMPPEECADPGEREAVQKILDEGEWIEFPKSHEFDLGKKLVFCFAEQHLTPQELKFIERIFSRRGAYRNWRIFLDSKDLTGKWYRFREAEEEKALKAWLAANDIVFLDDCAGDSSGRA